MANFESGVKGYVKATCKVTVYFPIDFKGREAIACKYCPFLSSNERMCQLNKEPVAFPHQYVGQYCPLEKVEEEKENV